MSPLIVRGAQELAAKTDRIAGRLERPDGAEGKVASILGDRIRARFAAGGEGDWPGHAAATDERWGPHPTMRLTGALEAGAHRRPRPDLGQPNPVRARQPVLRRDRQRPPADHARRRRPARRPGRRRLGRGRHGRRAVSADDAPLLRDPGTIYGRIITGATVERAALQTIRKYAPQYIRETCRQVGRDPLPDPRGYIVASTFDKWPEDQLPVVVVISPGWAGRPRRAGDGRALAPWSLAAGIVSVRHPGADPRERPAVPRRDPHAARPTAGARRARRRHRLPRRGLTSRRSRSRAPAPCSPCKPSSPSTCRTPSPTAPAHPSKPTGRPPTRPNRPTGP